MIPLRWKIWGLVAVAFVAGLFGLRASAARSALSKARTKELENAIERYVVRNEVENRIADDSARERLRDDWSR